MADSMRGLRVLAPAAAVLAFAAACARQPDVTASARPEPRNADLSVVAERYYQLIEGKHWSVADQMLSPRLRATLDEAALTRRYAAYTDAQIGARQRGAHAIVATLATPAGTLGETLTFRWDGSDWRIDRITASR